MTIPSAYGASRFLELTDTPANYSGSSLQVVRVNVGETALEFAAGGAGTTPRFQMNFYGEDAASGVTTVELMEENTDIGIPLARSVSSANVAVKFRRAAGAAPGDWTLRLFKNGVEAATFAVPTT